VDGAALGATVTGIASFTLQSGTKPSMGLSIPASRHIIKKWLRWTSGADKGKVRTGYLYLYRWTGDNFDASVTGDTGRGRLVPLTALQLNSVVISKFDLWGSSVTLQIGSVGMPVPIPPVPAAPPAIKPNAATATLVPKPATTTTTTSTSTPSSSASTTK